MAGEPQCPYCGYPSALASSAEVYGGRDYGPIYICRTCDAYVGCHKGTTKPLGRLANKELREWKKKAHAVFDPVWELPRESLLQSGFRGPPRSKAYARLAYLLGIPFNDCHIGMFDVEQCKQVVDLCLSGVIHDKQRR
jgi:hypothetical protein